jgi:hypothetical protein
LGDDLCNFDQVALAGRAAPPPLLGGAVAGSKSNFFARPARCRDGVVGEIKMRGIGGSVSVRKEMAASADLQIYIRNAGVQ